MDASHLTDLLTRLVAGDASPADVDEVRAAVADHPDLGELDVATLFADDVSGDAAALLGVLDGVREPAVQAALTAAAPVDVADAVLATLFGEAPDRPDVAEAVAWEAGRGPDLGASFDAGALPVAEAVAAEAGEVDVVEAVLSAVSGQAEVAPTGSLSDAVAALDDPAAWASVVLDHVLEGADHLEAAEVVGRDAAARQAITGFADVGRLVREGVRGEAGAPPQLWQSVGHAIGLEDPEQVVGWDPELLAEAVRAEAGDVAMADRVMARIEADLARAQALAADVSPVEPERAANTALWPLMAALAVAAALVMGVLVPQLLPDAGTDGFTERRDVTFATSDEVSVDKVSYGANTSVFVEVPDDEGPIIIWVDDEDRL